MAHDTSPLSLQPPADTPAATTSDVLILVDTSASQTGAYRQDAIDAVQTLLKGIPAGSRAHLAAIDLQFVPLSNDFATTGDASLQTALQQLERRAPLGSTDLTRGLSRAAAAFDREDRVPRHIVYVGDGISHADIPTTEQFSNLVNQLVQQKITFSSYAIGPARDIQLLAALANQTGGQVFVDAENVSGQQAGSALLQAIHTPVIWPTTTQLDDAIQESYPRRLPPLRADRDSIVIGSLRQGTDLAAIQIDGQVQGQAIQLRWPVETKASSDDFSFLPKLVEMARRDDGVSLPTLGTAALREIRRLTVDHAEDLSRLGNRR